MSAKNSKTVVQAYDGSTIRELELQEWPAVDAMLNRAWQLHEDRSGWLPSYERREVLQKLVNLMRPEAENFAVLIAREGGKPLTDARAEVSRAINGVELAIEEMGNLGGRQISMDLTPAGAGRTAFTYREPVGSLVGQAFSLAVQQVSAQRGRSARADGL